MTEYVKLLGVEENIFGDGIAKVEHWDFSRANLNDKSRIEAITKVASVCYDNPKAVGRESLYDRLKAESLGLPSSSFEFVPVLLTASQCEYILEMYDNTDTINSDKVMVYTYGEIINHDDEIYLLTNYRALLSDYDFLSKQVLGTQHLIDFTKWYNSEEECEIIAKNFNVFLSNLDMVTRTQYIRHRTSWQELSRRYVSGKKLSFSFYISEGMKKVHSKYTYSSEHGEQTVDLTTQKLIEMAEAHYFAALKQGVEPQEARRIIPQCAYTTVWSAWTPDYLSNFFGLRLDHHAQWEIRQLAEAKLRLIKQNR